MTNSSWKNEDLGQLYAVVACVFLFSIFCWIVYKFCQPSSWCTLLNVAICWQSWVVATTLLLDGKICPATISSTTIAVDENSNISTTISIDSLWNVYSQCCVCSFGLTRSSPSSLNSPKFATTFNLFNLSPSVFHYYVLTRPASSLSPELWDSHPFPMSRNGLEYASHLDEELFTNIRASNLASTVHDQESLLCGTDVGEWVKRFVHCGRRGMLVLSCVSYEVDCLFVHWYEAVEYERDLSMLVETMMDRCYPNLVRCPLFCTVLSITCNWPIGLFVRRVIATLSFYCISMSGRYIPDGTTSSCLSFPHGIVQVIASKPCLLARVGRVSPTLLSDASSLFILCGYMLRNHFRLDRDWCVVMSEFFVSLFISFFWTACRGNIASVSGNSGILNLKKGIIVSLPFCRESHTEQHHVCFNYCTKAPVKCVSDTLLIFVLERFIGVAVSRRGIPMNSSQRW